MNGTVKATADAAMDPAAIAAEPIDKVGTGGTPGGVMAGCCTVSRLIPRLGVAKRVW